MLFVKKRFAMLWKQWVFCFSCMACVMPVIASEESNKPDLSPWLEREVYRYELSQKEYPSTWVLGSAHVSIVCIENGTPLLLEGSVYYDLNVFSARYYPELPQARYISDVNLEDIKEFFEYARLRCQSIDEVAQLHGTLKRSRLIEYKVFKGENADWELQVSQTKWAYGDHLVVFSDGELEHLFSHEDPMDRYVSSFWMENPAGSSPLLISVWERGAHGEQLLVHDLDGDRVIYRVTSFWPLSYDEGFEKLTIRVTEVGASMDEPIEKEVLLSSADLKRLME